VARDPKVAATAALLASYQTHQLAATAKVKTRAQLNAAIVKAAELGIAKAEIARMVGTSSQRVGQIITSHQVN
jgi:hypothetical protein